MNVRYAQRARLQLPQKVAPPFVGPYKVIAKVAENAYRLELPPQASRTHDVDNVSQLKKYHSNAPELDLLEVEVAEDQDLILPFEDELLAEEPDEIGEKPVPEAEVAESSQHHQPQTAQKSVTCSRSS